MVLILILLITRVSLLSGVAMGRRRHEGGEGRPGSHHFGVTPFYDTNRTKKKKKKTRIRLIPLEIFSALERTKKGFKESFETFI